MFFLSWLRLYFFVFFFFQAEDGIRDADVTGVQTCALPILPGEQVRTLAGAERRLDERDVVGLVGVADRLHHQARLLTRQRGDALEVARPRALVVVQLERAGRGADRAATAAARATARRHRERARRQPGDGLTQSSHQISSNWSVRS